MNKLFFLISFFLGLILFNISLAKMAANESVPSSDKATMLASGVAIPCDEIPECTSERFRTKILIASVAFMAFFFFQKSHKTLKINPKKGKIFFFIAILLFLLMIGIFGFNNSLRREEQINIHFT